ncbi:MAG: hypothetical protein WBP44_01625 [Gammaproteobacteria bacterium]
MNHRKPCYAIIIACALLLSAARASEEQTTNATMDRLERQLELHHHSELLARMAAPGSTLAPFTTDGCSGGLSIGWEYLAGQVENVRAVHGTRPPWEDCCIAHDRLYHTAVAVDASAEESFAARKQADLALLSCVVETGNTRVAELTLEYDVSAETVATLYAAIAELMYRAVRLGGIPCSGLPWRWGYGWPQCA